MDASKRKFFGSFSAVLAAPVAGIASACGVREALPKPERAKPGGLITSKWFNDQFDAIYRALEQSRR